MGGCCCCPSKSNEDIGTLPFFHHPAPQTHRPSPNQATVSVLPSGLLVDTNLDTSIPDTYQPPPAPPPYETYGSLPPMSSGTQQGPECKHEVTLWPNNSEPIEDTNAASSLKTKVKKFKYDEKGEMDVVLEASMEIEEDLDELKKSGEPFVPPLLDEDDACPICLEEYNDENPKLITKCDHHFHLACILEWMERSDACPVCDQEMILFPMEG